jgi:hypothetical protein
LPHVCWLPAVPAGTQRQTPQHLRHARVQMFLRECAPHRTSHAPPQSAPTTQGKRRRENKRIVHVYISRAVAIRTYVRTRTFGEVDDLVRRRSPWWVGARSSLAEREQAKLAQGGFQVSSRERERERDQAAAGQEWTKGAYACIMHGSSIGLPWCCCW